MKIEERLRNMIKRFRQEIGFYKRVLKHPQTPRFPKFLLGIAFAYAASPVDLIPDFIPVIGYLDDLLILPLVVWVAIRLIPESVMMDCRQENNAMPRS